MPTALSFDAESIGLGRRNAGSGRSARRATRTWGGEFEVEYLYGLHPTLTSMYRSALAVGADTEDTDFDVDVSVGVFHNFNRVNTVILTSERYLLPTGRDSQVWTFACVVSLRRWAI